MAQRILAIVVILVAALGGGTYAYQRLLPPPSEGAEGPLYATAEVVRGDISVDVEASGPLNPSRGGGIQAPLPVGPMRGGPSSFLIEEILVKDGDAVRQGDPLIRLLAPEIESSIETAAKQLERDRADLAELLGVPPEEVTRVNPAQGVTIRAPIAGRILGLTASEGTEIRQGEIVARVVDDSEWEADVHLTPTEFAAIRQGDPVRIQFNQFSGFEAARIERINPHPIPTRSSELSGCFDGDPSPSADEGGGGTDASYEFTYLMTIRGANPGLVQPGMRFRAGFVTEGGIRLLHYCSTVKRYVKEERVINRAEGIVTQVFVDERAMVAAGDPILALSGDETQEAIEEKLASILEAEAELEQMRAQLDRLTVVAPMDGVVANIQVQEGQSVNFGDWMGSLFNTSDMRMWVQVDDVDVLRVRQDAPVEVTVDALPGKVFEGRVTEIATAGVNESGITQFQVGIQVQGGPDLRPGMQAHARIRSGEAKGVLLVPLEAVFEEDGQSHVEVLDADGTPRAVKVELGLMNDRVAEVKSGLEEGQKVITGSPSDLLPSQRIQSQDGLLPVEPGGGGGGSEEGGEGSGGSGGTEGRGPGGAQGGGSR